MRTEDDFKASSTLATSRRFRRKYSQFPTVVADVGVADVGDVADFGAENLQKNYDVARMPDQFSWYSNRVWGKPHTEDVEGEDWIGGFLSNQLWCQEAS